MTVPIPALHPTKLPEHEAVYQRLRDMILFGEVRPGQALTIMGVKDMIGAGMTPVREAIRRLTAEGALEALGNRRITVPRLTEDRLNEIEFARLLIEPKIVSLIKTPLNLVAMDKLIFFDQNVNQAIETGEIKLYLESNFHFHFYLYSLAEATILSNIVQSLWMQFGPSQRIVSGQYGTANLPDFHDETIAALKAGDTQTAAQAIYDDIKQGMSQVRDTLKQSS